MSESTNTDPNLQSQRPKRGRPSLAYDIGLPQILYAMQNSTSNLDAARWLKLSYETWKKYASLYIHPDTGLTCYETHKQTAKLRRAYVPKPKNRRYLRRNWIYNGFVAATYSDIFANKHPKYSLTKLMDRLVHDGHKTEKCDKCGYCTQRAIDLTVPLRCLYIDAEQGFLGGLDNIQFLCYNCLYIHESIDFKGAPRKWVFDPDTMEIHSKYKRRKTVKTSWVRIQDIEDPRKPRPEQ
jgi:hypothetical protein